MKNRMFILSVVLSACFSAQSFGFELLDRMLGVHGCGCAANCCETTCCETSCCETTCCDVVPGCGREAPVCGCDTGCCEKRGCLDWLLGSRRGCNSCGCDNGCSNNRRGCGFRPYTNETLVDHILHRGRRCSNKCCDNSCGCDAGCGCGHVVGHVGVTHPGCGCQRGHHGHPSVGIGPHGHHIQGPVKPGPAQVGPQMPGGPDAGMQYNPHEGAYYAPGPELNCAPGTTIISDGGFVPNNGAVEGASGVGPTPAFDGGNIPTEVVPTPDNSNSTYSRPKLQVRFSSNLRSR